MSSSPQTKRPVWRVVLFSLLPLFVLLALLEAGSRIAIGELDLSSTASIDKLYQGRSHNPALTSKDWYPGFKQAAAPDTGWTALSDDSTVLLKEDSTDPYITVVNGLRLTTGWHNRSSDRPARVFVLGGSTTFSAEVPNEYTWLSQLQKALSDEQLPLQLFNFGVTSASSVQELQRLEYEISRGNIPDAVVIYDGVNDVVQGVYYQSPQSTIAKTEKQLRDQLLTNSNDLSRKIIAQSKFLSWMSLVYLRWSARNGDGERLEQLSADTALAYAGNIRKVQALSEEHGFRTLVFLQPNLFSIQTRSLTPHEADIAGQVEDAYPGMTRAFEITYPKLQEQISQLRSEGVHIRDLSSIFDTNRKPVFLDWCHVESDGNAIIAQALLPFFRSLASSNPRREDDTSAGLPDKRAWTVGPGIPIKSVTTNTVNGLNNEPERLIDGNIYTFWTSPTLNAPSPVTIELDLGAIQEVEALVWRPRPGLYELAPGVGTKIQTSKDGDQWETALVLQDEGNVPPGGWRLLRLPPNKSRFVKLITTTRLHKGSVNDYITTFTEIEVHGRE